ncbi:hypothetical protein GTA08_BOTSDO04714 [Neofusicoccum parvum]|uniref:Uncharacterized protein n=1 Tax=Neofusicoccum parvum TaxID=310453 RepID=A0ACB5S1I1_9PEZI|nr:hypothetical protein GTA08_BOTSDO04714 [Neofusicoccum parvum]
MSRRHQPYTPHTRRPGGTTTAAARCITTRTRPEVQFPSAAAAPHDRRHRRTSTHGLAAPPPPDPELVIRNRRAATTRGRRADDADEYDVYVERRSRSRSRSRRRYDYGYGVPERRYGEEVVVEMPAGGGDGDEGEEGDEVFEPVRPVLGVREAAGMRYGDFRLSKRSKEVFGVLAREPGGGEEEEGGKDEGVQAARRSEGERGSEKRFRVLFSRWLENGSGGEDPVAELMVEPEVEVGVKRKWKGRGELFEWV